MPEIIEVEKQRQQLDTALHGRTLVYHESLYFRAGKPILAHLLRKHSVADFERNLLHLPIQQIDRIGKNLIFKTGPDTNFWTQIHLNSTGWFIPGNDLATAAAHPDQLHKSFIKTAVAKDTAKHAMVALTFDDGQVWYYVDPRTWGRIYPWRKLDVLEASVCDLTKYGPDWLREPEQCFDALRAWHRTSKRKVKQVLLDQFITAGIGNWMWSEICFHCRLHPLEDWRNISDLQIRDIATTINALIQLGLNSESYWFWSVFGKGGTSCPRNCNGTITYVKDAPNSIRGNYFCPNCQVLHDAPHFTGNSAQLFSGTERSATLLGVPQLPHPARLRVPLLSANHDRYVDAPPAGQNAASVQGMRLETAASPPS